MTAGRRIAYEVLLRVERGGAWANVALDAALREQVDLDPRERALATELVYGTLRRALSLDWILDQRSSRPVEGLDPEVRQILRLGAYQLLHLRVPDHAAVTESVELCKAVGRRGAAGFVNAVLRAVARGRDEDLAPPFEVDPALHLLVTEGLPQWLYAEWAAVLRPEEVRALSRAVNEPAPLVLRASSPTERDELVAALQAEDIPAKATAFSPVGLLVQSGAHPEHLPGMAEGRLQPQDEAAQLVTLFAEAPPSGATARIRRVLDTCAAPGGKTCHLAQSLPEAQIVAVDLHARRAARVAEEAERLGLGGRIETHAADATHPLPFAEEETFDLVLLDAPCTGLGTLRRHPEIKLRRGPDDVVRLAALQSQLLERAAAYVRRGGRLVYAVCTFTRAEGPDQIAAFLARHPEFVLDPPSAPAESEEAAGGPTRAGERRVPWNHLLAPDGTLVTWPHSHGADGFFAARLRRT